jgi:hypothetical protein
VRSTPRAALLAARSQPRPGPSPVAADPSPAIGLACDASVLRPVGGPPAGRSRRRGLGGSPSTRTKAPSAPGPWRAAGGRSWGVSVERPQHWLQAPLTFADADTEMLAAKRSVRTAGGSAGQRFKTLAKAWRRRALRPVFLACSGLVIGFAIAGTVVTGQAKFWLGALTGGTMALYMALRESPPWHIEKWRVGEEGERRTAKALRQLPGREWKAWHDLPGKNGTNVDHVVLGPAASSCSTRRTTPVRRASRPVNSGCAG